MRRLHEVGSMLLPETVLRDLRYAARMVSRNAGSTAMTVLALALGIGVNTAVFTAYKAMVARPLDARSAAEMVNLALTREAGTPDYAFSYPDYEAYRDSAHSLSGLIAFRPAHLTLSNAGGMLSQRAAVAESALGGSGLFAAGADNVELASVFVVSENYFKVLGATALRGRTFESTGRPGSTESPSVLISENYWQRRFAGDPAILGKTVYLNRLAVTVIGITPHDFTGTGIAAPGFWLPIGIEPLINDHRGWLRDRENRRYRLFGRLAAGAGIGQAQAELGAIADQLRALHDPRSESARPATVLVWPGSPFPLPLKYYGGLRWTITLIMIAAAAVLAIACANVGSLQLARTRSRDSELRTRLALGASRLRLVRQLITESALVGLLAGAVALAFTWAILKVGVDLSANALPVEEGALVFDVTPDLRIFAFVLVTSLAAGMLSGLAPAMESSRSALSAAARGSASPTRSRRFRDVLVGMQVALSLMLMIAGGMLTRGALHALHLPTGYDAKHVVDVDFQFPEGSKFSAAYRLAVAQELRARLAALPGVAAITSAQPPGDNRFRTAVVPLDGPGAADHDAPSILVYTLVQPNYFQTLAIPVVLGRSFQPQGGQPEPSVILSESAARLLWPGQNPIGRSLRLGPVDERRHERSELLATGPAYQVAGVVRDKRGAAFDGSDSKEIYLPLPEGQLAGRPILVRTRSDPAHSLRAIDLVASSIDPDMVATASSLEAMLRQSAPFIVSSLAAGVASAVGLFGLLLAMMGIYGTVSYIVVLRTREIGVRMAIGAQKHDVLGLVLRESTRPVLAGVLAGMLLAAGACYLMRGVLYGLQVVDGITFAGVSLLFLAIAGLAAYPPARRAMRVDPMVALRYE